MNFVNPLIMFLLIFGSLGYSVYLTRSQKRRDDESHKKDPAARVASLAHDDASHLSKKAQNVDLLDPDGLFEVSFRDLQCVVPGTDRLILPGNSGIVPAGKISALMGPTAWYVSVVLMSAVVDLS